MDGEALVEVSWRGWMEKLLLKSLGGDGWRSSCGSLLKGMDGEALVEVS